MTAQKRGDKYNLTSEKIGDETQCFGRQTGNVPWIYKYYMPIKNSIIKDLKKI